MPAKVLIVEDEEALTLLLRYNLEAEGYEVDSVSRGDEAEIRLRESIPDLVLLDWMLPGLSGIELCRRIRMRPETERLPVIMLTARGEETDRIRGLDTGADDYVIKPFSPREVAARVRAVLRRASKAAQPEEQPVRAGALSLDASTRKAAIADRELLLSRTEFNLLSLFLRSPGRVFERSQILDAVWGSEVVVGDRTVDVHVKALRRKIEEAGGDPRMLETVRGVGYRLRDDG
jgi:two-component system, OmpR family, phosphate regulon response regulator PhoB